MKLHWKIAPVGSSLLTHILTVNQWNCISRNERRLSVVKAWSADGKAVLLGYVGQTKDTWEFAKIFTNFSILTTPNNSPRKIEDR
ncbi:hypothetical protein LCGC14_2111990 [marine sediment metagenome]|uniref:Uncharacterized protein n=1 Tax=marine sediment metagenome TaxID=412755 RepID=A0A0F9GJX7_9ZZZZ